MRELHLFAGIGGGILGGLLLGHQPVGAVERDEFCRRVLRRRFPKLPIHDDIQTFDGRAFLDSLAKTSQDASMAGKPKKLSEQQLAEAAKLYEAGLSCSDLANTYGVSRQAMWERLKKVVSMRPQLRHGEDNHFYRGGPIADPWVHNVTDVAIRTGVLVQQPCEVCGKTGTMADGRNVVQAHHDDYNKPLEVRWLCQQHHHEWHTRNKPRRRTEAAGVDVVAGGFP